VASKPGLAQFESSSKDFQVVHIDVDQKTSPQYLEYIQYKEGGSIPYWAILDKTGKKVDGFLGGQSYENLVTRTAKYK
jgi:hypothetical protein